MQLRWWLSGPMALVALLAVSSVAYASVGVGIQAGPVRLSGAAHPGGSYALPAVYVVNTGTEEESLVIRIERVSPGNGRTIPPSWIQTGGSAVRLSHGQSARIPLELAVPATAKPGPYFSDVIVKGSTAISAGGANFGVAAATNLEFRVAPGAVSGPWLRLPGWLLPVIVGLLVVAGAAVLMRKSGLRLRIERQPRGSGPLAAGGDDNVA
jgi:hypothetical protein